MKIGRIMVYVLVVIIFVLFFFLVILVSFKIVVIIILFGVCNVKLFFFVISWQLLVDVEGEFK